MSKIPFDDEGMRVRRQVLGDIYVDASLIAAADQPARDFQAHLSSAVWSLWARPGLALRERSLLTLGMTAALGRIEEFALHLVGARRLGVTEAELEEVVLQVVAYCGAPAGLAARRALLASRAS